MSLFNFGKKKEKSCCCCGRESETEVMRPTVETGDKPQSIKVIGTGCRSCREQYKYVKTAVEDMALDVGVEHITEMEKAMKYGIMSMPAIVVNEQVVSAGKVLKTADVKALFYRLGYDQ